MDRRHFLLTSLAGVVAAPLAAETQPVEKFVRVGIRSTVHASTSSPARQSFEDGLKELGWTVGRNLVLERRFAEGQLDRLPELAQDLVRVNVDVIAALGPLAIRPALVTQSARAWWRAWPVLALTSQASPGGLA